MVDHKYGNEVVVWFSSHHHHHQKMKLLRGFQPLHRPSEIVAREGDGDQSCTAINEEQKFALSTKLVKIVVFVWRYVSVCGLGKF